MNWLIIAATAREIAPFLEYYRNAEKNKHLELQIDVLISGIGLTATTYNLVKQFSIRKPDMVVQAGVAGCFDNSLPLGTVVAVKQDTIGDESVVELKNLKTLFELRLVPQNQHPYKNGWLINPAKEMLKRTKLKTVRGISVNQITTSKEMIQFYKEQFKPVTESMEGAALHYVCLSENVPFLQIRSISNYIGERNKKKWNMAESISRLNKELIRLLESI